MKLARTVLSLLAAVGIICGASSARAEPFVVTTSIVQGDLAAVEESFQPLLVFLENQIQRPVTWFVPESYEKVIDGLAKAEIHLAALGPAGYAEAWRRSAGSVTPLVAIEDEIGDFGYYSVLAVARNSPFLSLDDLAGKRLAFVDQHSTSGFHAPKYFLFEAGYDPFELFASTLFSGSHDASIALLGRGEVDAIVTWFSSDKNNALTEGVREGRIEADGWRELWRSPLLPDEAWTLAPAVAPELARKVARALMAFPQADPNGFRKLYQGTVYGFREVSHEDYDAVVRMTAANKE